MPITEPFDEYSAQYEQWFSDFRAVYESEVEALREILPQPSVGEKEPVGLEIGAGSGLFARPLGLQYGLEPSPAMMKRAADRGIEMKQGAAERLPYPDDSFDYTLMVTAICFLDDIDAAMEEIRRVLHPGGCAVFGFVDLDSPLGQFYLEHKDEDVFYREATFYSSRDVIGILERHGFEVEAVRQTVFGRLDEIEEVQPSKNGRGEGGFVVIRARSA